MFWKCFTAMKKIMTIIFSVIVAAVIAIAVAVTLFKKDEGISITTKLSVNSDFAGERKISYVVPNSVFLPNSQEEKIFNNIITKYCPAEFEYRKTTDTNSITYTFTIPFTSKTDYENKLSSILGRKIKIIFSNPDTVFMSGWIIEEEFESINLLYWINQGIERENQTKKLNLKIDTNYTSVSYNGVEQETEAIINIRKISGTPVKKIRIETLNYKDNRYNRIISFYINKSVYDKSEKSIKDYFAQRVNTTTNISWSSGDDNNIICTLSLNQCDIRQLENFTNNILNSVYSEISYSNISDTSLFSEEDMFDEILDFSNYIGNNNQPVTVEYIYSINGNNLLSEGSVELSDGTWDNNNLTYLDENISGRCFAIKNNSNSLHIRVSDGVKYKVKAVNIILGYYNPRQKGDNYSKTIEFIYDSTQIDGYNYALSYFKSKNANIYENTNDSGDLICAVEAGGKAQEISTIFSLIFENQSYMSYSENNKSFEAVANNSFCDYVRLSKVLGTENGSVPITYKIYARPSETILSLWYYVNGNKTDVHLDYMPDGAISFNLSYPDADIYYNGSYPITSKIIIIILIGLIIISGGIFVIIKLRNIPVKKFVMIDINTNNNKKDDNITELTVTKQDDIKNNDDLPWFDQIIDDEEDNND